MHKVNVHGKRFVDFFDRDLYSRPDFHKRESMSDANFKLLKRSLEEHGQRYPVVVRKAGENLYEVLDGWQRLQACDELGNHSIKFTAVEVDEKQAMEIHLALNSPTSDFDYEFLEFDFGEIAKEWGIEDFPPPVKSKSGKSKKGKGQPPDKPDQGKLILYFDGSRIDLVKEKLLWITTELSMSVEQTIIYLIEEYENGHCYEIPS